MPTDVRYVIVFTEDEGNAQPEATGPFNTEEEAEHHLARLEGTDSDVNPGWAATIVEMEDPHN